MLVIGVDPGLSGAIAFIGDGMSRVFDLPTVLLPGNGTIKRRVHGPGLYQLVVENCAGRDDVHAVIEDLTTGGQDNMVQTQVSQGRTRGTIECVLELVGLQVHAFTAQRWKKFYAGTSDKKSSLIAARTLYPGLQEELARVADHNRAESVLVAHWGWRTRPWEVAL